MPLAALPLLLALIGIQSSSIWLDQPLANWNKAGAPVPAAPVPVEPLEAVAARCRLTPLVGGAARAVAAAGWLPFNYFGQPLAKDDVQIVGGMTGADGMCRPTQYNVFVFVAGRFAGTLSPAQMTSREDGSSGAVRLAPPEITVEFARYTPRDPLCCPSAHATMRFRIARTPGGAVVVPIDVAAGKTEAR
jgi:hypothetical protein